MDFAAQTEATIETWHALVPPNPAALVFAADLENTIRSFESTRELLAFEDEPSDFAAALKATKA